jgi:hypothetical protein
VSSQGDISGYKTGIEAFTNGNGGIVTVTSIGNISTVGANGFGIRASNGASGTAGIAGNATVNSTGNISALGANDVS